MKWVKTWHDIQFLNNMYNLIHINEHIPWFLNDMYHLTCYTFSFTSTKQHTLQPTHSWSIFYQVLIQSTFNEKNKDNSNDVNDDNQIQDILASNQHQLLLPKGMNCTPRYQVDYSYAQGMLIMHKPWNKHNTLEHNETHHCQRRIPNRCNAIPTNFIIFPSKRWKELKLKDYLSTWSYFH